MRPHVRDYLLGLATGVAFVPVAWFAGHMRGQVVGVREGELHASSPLDVVDAEIYCGAKLKTFPHGNLADCKLRDGHELPHESEMGHLWR